MSGNIRCFWLLFAGDVGQFCWNEGLMFPPLIHQGFGGLDRVAKNLETSRIGKFFWHQNIVLACLSCVLPSGDNTIIAQLGPHLLPLINLKGLKLLLFFHSVCGFAFLGYFQNNT